MASTSPVGITAKGFCPILLRKMGVCGFLRPAWNHFSLNRSNLLIQSIIPSLVGAPSVICTTT